jgi:AraC-like DNA-binding protein/quercetin dioxygenase-like cupin family protein
MSERCHSVLEDKHGKRSAEVATLSYDFQHGHVIPEHSHPEDQFVFASTGVMTVRAQQGVWVEPPLRAVWIPAGIPHSIAMSGAVSMRTLYLAPKLVRGIAAKCFVMNVSTPLRELVLHACKFPKLRRPIATERRIIEIIVDQLAVVGTIPLQLPQPSDRRARRIARAVLADPGEQRTLDRHCERCGASKRTVQRLFIAETGMTFAKWRQQLRLLHALQLLASGEKVIGAALEAGYSSTSAFISMFKKQLGATPGRYFEGQELP